MYIGVFTKLYVTYSANILTTSDVLCTKSGFNSLVFTDRHSSTQGLHVHYTFSKHDVWCVHLISCEILRDYMRLHLTMSSRRDLRDSVSFHNVIWYIAQLISARQVVCEVLSVSLSVSPSVRLTTGNKVNGITCFRLFYGLNWKLHEQINHNSYNIIIIYVLGCMFSNAAYIPCFLYIPYVLFGRVIIHYCNIIYILYTVCTLLGSEIAEPQLYNIYLELGRFIC